MPSPQRFASLALALALAPGFLPTQAFALGAAESACRETIAKSVAGYASTLGKLVVSCHSKRSTGVRPLSDDCNNVDVADSYGTLNPLRDSMRSAIVSACSGASALMSQYTACPSPAVTADDGGATTGIDDFGEVADCLQSLADAEIGLLGNDAQGSPDERLLDPLRKCQGQLGKGTSRLVKTYLQEGRRCQKMRDASGGGEEFTCGGVDERGRIQKSLTKYSTKMALACTFSPMVLGTLDACDDDVDGLVACSRGSATTHGSSLTRGIYVLDGTSNVTTTTTTTSSTTTTTTTTTTLAGTACGSTFPTCGGTCPSGTTCTNTGSECTCSVSGSGACAPATIFRNIHAKYGPIPSATSLSTGWSGATHDVDIPELSGDAIDVECDENCENCQISLNTAAGNPLTNCRCTGDSTQTCNVINGSDPDHCGTLDPTCRCYFGAPLPLSSGGTPACVVNRIRTDYTGTMNLRAGEWNDRIQLAAIVYLGLDQLAPCPTCDGDPTPNDGVRGGTCAGGLGGGACDANGVHATFGATSWDCLPAAASNISGAGLLIDLRGSTGSQSLTATRSCDTPNGEQCPCRVCTGNANLGCSSDAECAAASAGTCTAGGGAGVVLNQCDGFQCGADGRCTSGPVDLFCDGQVHPDGRGFIQCSGDGDCTPLSAGSCTVQDIRRCFPDPIAVDGTADTYDPTTASIFCIAPTSNAAVNLAAGLPGPGTLKLQFTSDIRCRSNKNVVYEFPDGANCEGSTATTTTTLLPLPECENSDSPVCGGVCPLGSACTDSGGSCVCTGLPLPSCDDATAPSCGGVCPEVGDLCQDDGNGQCECQTATLPQCSQADSPACGGLCPTGETCTDVGGSCECGAPSLPNCSSAISPTCVGACGDLGSVCVDQGGACGCAALPLPTCNTATSPSCLGTCATGSLCQDVGGGCQCVLIPLP